MRFFLYFLIALSPLPFGSARPLWQWFWVLIIGLMAIQTAFQLVKHKGKKLNALYDFPKWILALSMCFVMWGGVQSLLGMAGDHINPQMPTSNPALTLAFDPYEAWSVAVFFAAHFLLFILILANMDDQMAEQLQAFIGHVVTVYAIYGLISYYEGNKTLLWFNSWTGSDSLTSTFVNRNNFATYCGFGLCAVAGRFLEFINRYQDQRYGSLKAKTYHLLLQFFSRGWLLMAELIALLSALFLTASRGGVIASIAALILLFVLGWPKSKKGRTQFTLAAIFVFLVIGAFSLSGGHLIQRLSGNIQGDSRFHIYSLALSALADRPMTGYGLGGFEAIFHLYRPEGLLAYFRRAHSDPLELALNVGIPATIILGVILFATILYSFRRKSDTIMCKFRVYAGISASLLMCLHSLVDFSMQIPAVSYLFIAFLASTVPARGRRQQFCR